MRIFLFVLLILGMLLMDFYVFKRIVSFKTESIWIKVLMYGLLIGMISSLYLIVGSFLYFRGTAFYPLSTFMVYFMGITFTFLIAKIIFTVYFGVSDLMQLTYDKYQLQPFDPNRRTWIKNVGLGMVALQIGVFFGGVSKGRYNYFKKRVTLKFKDLPEAFDGFKLVHISDIHSGSFDQPEEVKKGVDMIADLNADMLVFTGDLVNEYAYEATPIVPFFKALDLPYGKYACLGNHDYGTHARWNDEEEKSANFMGVQSQYKNMGFQLLNNTHVKIEKNGNHLVLAGVENWGKPPFPQTGDLNLALEGVSAEDFTVLLSHDPTHWELKAKNHPKKLALTLSGHTHGMQMGIDSKWLKWSPVKYVYKYWMGLYQEQEQFLYVNRGFGYIGFPGRIGIYPEITEIVLKRDV